MIATALSGGFAHGPRDSALAFRAIMTAMARPGTIVDIAGAAPPPPLSAALGAVILTLADTDTGLWLAPALATSQVRDWIDFHTGAPTAPAASATLVIGAWGDLPHRDAKIGTPDYPDRAATLLVDMQSLQNDGTCLSGPGIEDRAWLNLPEPEVFRANSARFPLGFDTIFCAGSQLACLPRSTKIGAL